LAGEDSLYHEVQVRHSALVTSLGIGILHSLWHTPLFFIEGVSQHEIAQQIGFLPGLLGYSVLVTAGAVQSTWIFNNSKGSVLLVAVYHGALNAWNGYIDIYRGQMAGRMVKNLKRIEKAWFPVS